MLARLVSAQQVVILYKRSGIYLFYQGIVYWRNPRSPFDHLPLHKTVKTWRIWTLIDIDKSVNEPPLEIEERVWPIQAASPNPDQYQKWVKYFYAAVLGMPRWSEEELLRGYVLSLFLVPAADAGHLV